jgi:hypothetical protein
LLTRKGGSMKKLITLGVLSLAILVMCDRAPETGTIEVTSDPTGADVFLDDSLTGQKTNCTLEDVPFGKHKLRLYLEGYIDWEREIEVNEEQPDEEINAGLTEAVPLLQVNSHPQGADIWLDGEQTDYTTNHLFADLDEREYTVRLTMDGYDDYDTTVTLVQGDTTLVEHEFDSTLNHPPQILTVSASPNPVEPGANSTISCTASDADGDQLSFEWYSVVEDTTYTSQTFLWEAPAIEGNYSFYLIVSDGNEGFDYDSSLVVTVEIPGISPVTLLPAADIGTNEATLIWTAAEPSWDKYELYRSETPGVTEYANLVVSMTSATGHTRLDTAYMDTDLEPGRDYYYAVLVTDSAANEAWSNEILVTTRNFEFLGSQSLGGGHGVRLACKGIYIFCAAREQAVKIFTIDAGGLGIGPTIPHPDNDVSAWAYDLVVTGNLLHVAFGKGGYRSYDITNPFIPNDSSFLDEFTLGGEARAVFALGSAIFVGCTDPATATHTLVYFDYINPGTLYIDTIFDVPEDIYVANNYIYVAEGHAGMEILSWNPTAPDPMQPVTLYSTNDAAHRVYISGQYAYVAASSEGLIIIDVSNPSNPYMAGQWQDDIDGNDAQSIYFSGVRCYLADGEYGLRILDITIPIYPEHIDTKDITDDVGSYKLMDVVIRSEGSWTQAILADWNNAVHMIRW